MEYILGIAIAIVVLLVVVPVVRRYVKTQKDLSSLHEEIYNEKEHYSFLIDPKFTVKDTNYYQVNHDVADDQPYVLGNVLHCQNGCDSGLCGTGMACGTCPVRLVIKNSFKQKRDFSNLEATLNLYNGDFTVEKAKVKVDGKLTYVGYKPHMMVSVAPSE